VINQEPSGQADRKVSDGEHARLVTAAETKRNRFVRRGCYAVACLAQARAIVLSAQRIHELAPTALQIERLVLPSIVSLLLAPC
jgi:hypothetical protein